MSDTQLQLQHREKHCLLLLEGIAGFQPAACLNAVGWLAILRITACLLGPGLCLLELVESLPWAEQEGTKVKHDFPVLAQLNSAQGTQETNICPERFLTLVSLLESCLLICLSLSPTAHTITM